MMALDAQGERLVLGEPDPWQRLRVLPLVRFNQVLRSRVGESAVYLAEGAAHAEVFVREYSLQRVTFGVMSPDNLAQCWSREEDIRITETGCRMPVLFATNSTTHLPRD